MRNAPVWSCAEWPDSATGFPIGAPSRENWTEPSGTVAGVVVSLMVAVSVAVCPWTGCVAGTVTVVVVTSSSAGRDGGCDEEDRGR